MMMNAARCIARPLLYASFALLAACSSGRDESRVQPTDHRRTFSDDDKKAALALSIGNTQIMAQTEGPYSRALLCRNGMEALFDRLRVAKGLSDNQIDSLEQARAYFDERLRILAGQQGKTATDVRRDLERVAQENSDPTGNARIAIGCLQKLLARG